MGVVLAQRARTLPHASAMCFLLCSDGTLNPNGVRFGSSEIYNIGSCMSPAILTQVQGGPISTRTLVPKELVRVDIHVVMSG